MGSRYLMFIHSRVVAFSFAFLVKRFGGFNKGNQCYLTFERVHFSLLSGHVRISNLKYADVDMGVNITDVTVSIKYWKSPSDDVTKNPQVRA